MYYSSVTTKYVVQVGPGDGDYLGIKPLLLGAAFDLHRTFYSSRLIVGKSGSPKSSQLQSCPVQACQSYVVHRQSVDEHRAINKVRPSGHLVVRCIRAVSPSQCAFIPMKVPLEM